eukprot:scaffold173516_cov27-Tisochrysis_lutea.AAC.6
MQVSRRSRDGAAGVALGGARERCMSEVAKRGRPGATLPPWLKMHSRRWRRFALASPVGRCGWAVIVAYPA